MLGLLRNDLIPVDPEIGGGVKLPDDPGGLFAAVTQAFTEWKRNSTFLFIVRMYIAFIIFAFLLSVGRFF